MIEGVCGVAIGHAVTSMPHRTQNMSYAVNMITCKARNIFTWTACNQAMGCPDLYDDS
jgi:hypothetical protein